jgi:diadenylate cyclase
VHCAAIAAPGTELRTALDTLVATGLGALIVVGDEERVSALADAGFELDAPFSAEGLCELCKMDGAVTLDAGVRRILRANVHLAPDRRLPTSETGIRHRTAEQLSRATDALVIAVSEQRGAITLYHRGERDVVTA